MPRHFYFIRIINYIIALLEERGITDIPLLPLTSNAAQVSENNESPFRATYDRHVSSFHFTFVNFNFYLPIYMRCVGGDEGIPLMILEPSLVMRFSIIL